MESHTWHHFFPILAWIIADADVARHTLDHAADELEGAADATGDAPVRRFLRRHVLDTARDRVAALRSWEPRPVAAAAGAALPLRPNRGLLVNVKRGIDLLLGSEPSAVVMRSFSLRDPRQRSRHEWYPAWLAGVQSAVDNAVRRLSRARSDMEAVCSDVDAFLAVPTPAHSAQACAAAARHARSAVANLGALVHILRVLEDELEDEPPTARVVQFFGYSVAPPPPPPPANGAGPAAGGAAAAAAAAAGDAA